jgi:hypothetical protein
VTRLPIEVLYHGLVRAIGRFTGGGETIDPFAPPSEPDLTQPVLTPAWSAALFESLNWAVSLDDRLRRDDDNEWATRVDGGGVVRGIRYARNCVHHDWASALDLGEDEKNLVAPYGTVLGIAWQADLSAQRPDPLGAQAYATHLAGRIVGDTLVAAAGVYEQGLKPVTAAQASPEPQLLKLGGKGDLRHPRLALYHCAYPEDDFTTAASTLHDLVRATERNIPRAERLLYLDIEGHRTKSGGFDHDMFELQRHFVLEHLLPFLSEAHLPLAAVRNSEPQRDDVPDELVIRSVPSR